MRLAPISHPIACAVTLAAGLAFAASTAMAQQTAPSYSGATLYETYCKSCHGEGGKGDGTFASALRRPPADLTQITAKNNGEFPEARVAQIIDGRDPNVGHSGGDMPVWGDAFLKSRDGGTEENVKARIDALVRYIRTLQPRS